MSIHVPQFAGRPQLPQERQPSGFARAVRSPRPSLALRADESAAGALLRFRSLMHTEGRECHLARLRGDRLYAYERIAAAYSTPNENLRRLALELFQIFHRCDPAERPAQ